MTYSEFGSAFVLQAVTPARIQGVLDNLTGELIEVGPISAGPGGAARALAKGRISPADIQRTSEEPLAFTVTLPVEITLDVDVAGSKHAFSASLRVTIKIAIFTAAPLAIHVQPAPVTARDVTAKISAKGIRAKAIGAIGDIDNELKKHVAEYVNQRIEGPDAKAVTTIDLLPIMDEAWPGA